MVKNFISIEHKLNIQGKPLKEYLEKLSAESFSTKYIMLPNAIPTELIYMVIPLVFRVLVKIISDSSQIESKVNK
jgi:hypothetical protein